MNPELRSEAEASVIASYKEAKKKAKPRKKKGAVSVTDLELKKAKQYSMTGVFDVGDVIKHKHFGPGKVVEMKANKMEVGFEDGPKLLVCRTD